MAVFLNLLQQRPLNAYYFMASFARVGKMDKLKSCTATGYPDAQDGVILTSDVTSLKTQIAYKF